MNVGIIGTHALNGPTVPQVIGMCAAAAMLSQSDGDEQPCTQMAAAPPNAPRPIIGTMPMSLDGAMHLASGSSLHGSPSLRQVMGKKTLPMLRHTPSWQVLWERIAGLPPRS